MRRKHLVDQLLLTSILYLTTLDASAIMTIKPRPAEPGHEHHRGMGKVFTLTGFENSTIRQVTPDLDIINLGANQQQIPFKSMGKDNYHALVATRNHNGVEETAIRYIYGRGKPTGHSPKELTDLQKSTLEIVPDPIPREHWHYKAGHEAAFIVRYKHQPLASIAVSLATSHASIVNARTDARGRVVFTVPDDYKVDKPGRRENKPAELLVHVKHQHNEKNYATWLAADYEANPAQWKNTQMGALVATGGFIFGAFITGLGLTNNSSKRREL
ncbi:MAG: DUF4198 domain-containing protein [Gammaproteobacteria bacterium]|nr:DUF4198 domain-containing protein [Gammaproteobacteria bacterium]